MEKWYHTLWNEEQKISTNPDQVSQITQRSTQPYIVIVNSWFLLHPQKRSSWNRHILKCLINQNKIVMWVKMRRVMVIWTMCRVETAMEVHVDEEEESEYDSWKGSYNCALQSTQNTLSMKITCFRFFSAPFSYQMYCLSLISFHR